MVGRALAVIPARGGSKRIPKKAILPFQGRPMIAWTIEAALRSGCFDRVVVSTDSAEIAEVAKQHGAEVPFLRDQHHDDNAPVSLAVVATLSQLMASGDRDYDMVVQLMPNCPLRGQQHIRDAVDHWRNSGADFQISCFRFGWMNPWWAFRIKPDETPDPLFSGFNQRRSQDLETLYAPTGAIWIASPQALMEARTFYGPGHIAYPLDWRAAVDIDDYEDLKMAEVLFRVQAESGEEK